MKLCSRRRRGWPCWSPAPLCSPLPRRSHLRFEWGGIDSLTGFSAPLNLPREAIPAPHHSLISYPSHVIPRLEHCWQAGLISSHWIRFRLHVQQPLWDRWRWLRESFPLYEGIVIEKMNFKLNKKGLGVIYGDGATCIRIRLDDDWLNNLLTRINSAL